MDMTAEAAQARAQIRSDAAANTSKVGNELGDKIDFNERNAAMARADLDKRLALIIQEIAFLRELTNKKK